MAEAAAYSLASNILSKIAPLIFHKGYEKGIFIWEAKKELSKLKVTIETIQAVLLDAEKKQESAAAVKNWIQRLKAVLYDADDLFDEVATDDLLKQQMRKKNYKKLSLKKKVSVSCFNLNPIVARNSIAKKVKAVRKSLLDISSDMAGFGFVPCGKDEEVPCNGGLRRGQDPGCFVDADDIIGRDEDKKAILNMLFNESYDARSDVPIAVVAIVGIGGMGKTALAQLVYNDDEVIGKFEQRWFACISDISDEKQVIGKIFQSICEGKNDIDFTLSHLQKTVRESIEGKKFMLVLDDVWDEDHDRWLRRLKLLSGGARGSRIIVTTRSYSAAAAVIALVTHSLHGLSDDDSWRLFRRVAFASGDENETRRIDLGREIVNKCRNVPLAIRSIGSLLYEKNTIQEWESIRGEELPKLGICHVDGIMPVLKLSYDHLPPILKQCFAYCSLFPKDYRMFKRWLIYLWIAQGYIKENDEAVGHSHFMYLLRRGFFQETVDDSYGEIQSCKIHDLIHDLAQHVAGDETIMLTTASAITTSNRVRHVCNGDVKIEESWVIPEWLLNVKGLRSFMLLNGTIGNPNLLDQTFARFSRLRALVLRHLGIENVPSSIGELKHLRYLNLSWNNFERLPDSLTNLLNLVTLNIIGCNQLTALPEDIIKLINLRCLLNKECKSLKHLPSGIGEMSCLQYLSSFKVGKGAISEGVTKKAGLDELARLQYQLKGGMFIKFEDGMDEEEIREGDECKWQMPLSLRGLFINGYPGRGIADWDMACTNTNNNLAVLRLWNCKALKHLPPLRHLPNLKDLILKGLAELEYVEEEGTNDPSSSFFFLELSLKKLKLDDLPKVKGWWRRKVASTLPPPQFPLLSDLWLEACPELELKSFPLCPCLRKVDLIRVDDNEVIQEQWPLTIFGRSSSNLVSSIEKIRIQDCKWLGGFHGGGLESLRSLDIIKCSSLQSVHLASPHLQTTVIRDCDELVSFELHVEAPTTSLQKLEIVFNKQLKNLHIPSTHLNALEELHIVRCNVDLDFLDKSRECRLDWDSLTSLRVLRLVPLPTPERIPDRLRQRHALGQLKIMDENSAPISFDALRLGSELSSEQQH